MSATKNWWESDREPNNNAKVLTPKVLILEPLAATKVPVAALGGTEEVSGITDTSGPLSTKNRVPELMSLIEIVPLIIPGPREDTEWR